MGKTMARIAALGRVGLKIYLVVSLLVFVGGIIAGAVLAAAS